jgi:hypothetical protein
VKGITDSARPISLKATGIAPEEKKADAPVSFRMPDRSSPTYRVSLTIPGDQVPEGRISMIEVGTFECRDYEIRQGDREIFDRRTEAGEALRIVARYDWRAEEETEIHLLWEEAVEGLEYPARAGSPGWWDEAWAHYVGVSLEETAGIGRQGEPVHLCLALFADRLTAGGAGPSLPRSLRGQTDGSREGGPGGDVRPRGSPVRRSGVPGGAEPGPQRAYLGGRGDPLPGGDRR